MEEQIIRLQSAIGEASLIMECSGHLIDTEHRDRGRLHEMIALLTKLARERLDEAMSATSEIEVRQP